MAAVAAIADKGSSGKGKTSGSSKAVKAAGKAAAAAIGRRLITEFERSEEGFEAGKAAAAKA